jgi:hypothetical protein
VQREIGERVQQADALRTTQLERARYEAELARRRYMAIDPDNRLVADQLEADWNERLRRLDALTQEQQRQRKADENLLTEDAHQRLAGLTRDFARVWNDSRTSALDRKRMLALLIEDVTLVKDKDISIHVRMRGGRTCTLSVPRPVPMALVRKTRPEVVQALDELLETCTDRQAAEQLNLHGHRSWQGLPFDARKVWLVRHVSGLKSRFQRLRERGLLTGAELARQLGVSEAMVHQLGREGLLARQLYGNADRCLYEPLHGKILVQGKGGPRPIAHRLIDAPSPTQEAV